MTAPQQTGPPAAPHRRPHRRPHRWRATGIAVVLLALLGTGARWIGSGDGRPEDGGDEANRQAAAGESVAPSGRQPERPIEAPAPILETSSPLPEVADEPETATATPTPPTVDADRFASLKSVVERGLLEQRFAEARAALEVLRTLPLSSAQTGEIERLQDALGSGLSAAASALVDLVRAGSVLSARGMLRQYGDDPAEQLALQAALRAIGLGPDLTSAPTEERSRWPLPAPLEKDRLVRASLTDRTVLGRVVDSRPERITLRVAGPRGLTFPTVRTVACEPVEVDAAEATEMAFAALQAGDPVLARLWLGCAQSRSAAPGPRTVRLQALLR